MSHSQRWRHSVFDAPRFFAWGCVPVVRPQLDLGRFDFLNQNSLSATGVSFETRRFRLTDVIVSATYFENGVSRFACEKPASFTKIDCIVLHSSRGIGKNLAV